MVAMFSPLPYGDPDLARVLVLVAHHEGRRDAVGSAVMVLPGLALTALHVITEPLRVYRGELLEEGREHKLDAKFDMNALTPHADGTFTEWRIRQASSSRHSDIAWLQMDTAGRVPDLPPIRLTLIPPRRESAVVAFGYPGAQVMIGEKRIEVAAQPVRSTGRT